MSNEEITPNDSQNEQENTYGDAHSISSNSEEDTLEQFNIFSHLSNPDESSASRADDAREDTSQRVDPYASTDSYATGAYSYSYTQPTSSKLSKKSKKRQRAGISGLIGATLVATVVASTVGAGVGYEVAKHSTDNAAPIIKQVTAAPLASTTSSLGASSVPQLLSKVEPAIVDINTSGYITTPSNGFFGGSTSSQFQAAGTGMIISPNGYVLTNNHVIANATSISVTLFNSKKTYRAKVIGTNPTHDVAVLQIEGASNLPTVTLGNSNTMKVGDPVVAIGNALALQGTPTVTEGIISALGRTITAQSETGATETLNNMIQTDAPINPGNSGGPLLNSSGYVIGMNTAAATGSSSSQSAQGIGFAEPINSVLTIVKQIESHPNGSTAPSSAVSSHGFLGVGVQNLTPSLASQLGYSSSTTGALVDNVVANSPAMSAGIQSGDVIQAIGSTQISTISQLVTAIQSKSPGTSVTITWLDPNSGKNSATVTLASTPPGA